MQRFNDKMVEDDEGDYVLYVDMMDAKAELLYRHLKIMESTRNHTKLMTEQLEQLQ